jgi:hypothetical protein
LVFLVSMKEQEAPTYKVYLLLLPTKHGTDSRRSRRQKEVVDMKAMVLVLWVYNMDGEV